MANFLTKIFGTHSSRELKKIYPIADKIESLASEYSALTDTQLREKTAELQQRYQNGESLDSMLPEAFANCREAATRVLGMRHYRVQLIGGIVLHQGRIAEMKTGEGKTLVATLPAYLNALTGKGVHIVTVNDYLARRDSEWMGKLYRFLGLSVGLIVHDVAPQFRKGMYAADITYGTNNEFGFDYLRDNMANQKEQMVQRGHAFAIVDEVDSILIDEARTPLIISGQGEESSELYKRADEFVIKLKQLRVPEMDAKVEMDDIDADYVVDEKARTATLTPRGQEKAEAAFGIENLSDDDPDHKNADLQHYINQALKARGVMQRDVDYVVRDGKIIIVDEFTGRLMFGRRYNEGLHQAIEAKEGVEIQHESKTLATITFQNYFRLYGKLSGMTGTALTEEEEFRHTYKLDVVEIPTNRPIARKDRPDTVYKNERGKFKATIARIEECHAKGQPILVGTVSIEKSEQLSALLKAKGIKHTVLNAKYHEQEADIVAQAGRSGAVTIATNMAGRGTDIMLGGNAETMALDELKKQGYPPELLYEANGHADTDNPEIIDIRQKFQELYEAFKKETDEDGKKVREAGGLFILGTERHESRRIDNQLRGRAGRQGDPGESSFYLSLEDDLMRLFGSERIQNMMDTLGIEEDEPIDQRILSGAIENAQKKIESRNFATRKHVLEYDNVLNTQRQTIYAQRLQVLEGQDVRDNIMKMIDDTIARSVHSAVGENRLISQEMVEEARKPFIGMFLQPDECQFTPEECDDLTSDQLKNELCDYAHKAYEANETELAERLKDPSFMRTMERNVLLHNVDEKWMDHIDAMTELRNGIGLRAFGQHDPVVEYKREGFDMFDAMINAIREDTVQKIFQMQKSLIARSRMQEMQLKVQAKVQEKVQEMLRTGTFPKDGKLIIEMPEGKVEVRIATGNRSPAPNGQPRAVSIAPSAPHAPSAANTPNATPTAQESPSNPADAVSEAPAEEPVAVAPTVASEPSESADAAPEPPAEEPVAVAPATAPEPSESADVAPKASAKEAVAPEPAPAAVSAKAATTDTPNVSPASKRTAGSKSKSASANNKKASRNKK